MMRSLVAATFVTGVVSFGSIPDGSCGLEAVGGDGGSVWVQTGGSFHFYTSESHPRQLITTQGVIEDGTFFSALCTADGYQADYGCVVQCKDGVLDYSTYCQNDPVNVCKHYTMTDMYQGCVVEGGLWNNEYFKAAWPAALERWNPHGIDAVRGAGSADYTEWNRLWTTQAAGICPDGSPNFGYFAGASCDPAVGPPYFGAGPGSTGMPIYPHGHANLIYMGLGLNTAINQWDWTDDGQMTPGIKNYKPLSLESFNLDVLMPFSPDFTYVTDPGAAGGSYGGAYTSTADGARFFPDAMNTKSMAFSLDGVNYLYPLVPGAVPPAAWDMRAMYLGVIAMPYDPSHAEGDSVFMGLPKKCYHIHQPGLHMNNGQMAPFYPPLTDGRVDFFGVCGYEQSSASQYMAVLQAEVLPNAATNSDDGEFVAAMTAAGGNFIPHGRTWGLHLCIDYTKGENEPGGLNKPYPCTLPATAVSQINAAGGAWLSNQMILDALSFVPDPAHSTYSSQLIADAAAGLCDPTQYEIGTGKYAWTSEGDP